MLTQVTLYLVLVKSTNALSGENKQQYHLNNSFKNVYLIYCRTPLIVLLEEGRLLIELIKYRLTIMDYPSCFGCI